MTLSLPNETKRLTALARYDIFDTPRERSYDEITRLVARICEVPIAIISFVAEDQQCFKSQVGLDPTWEPPSLEHSICVEAIRHPEPLFVVPDLCDAPRFAGDPLVTEVGLRFYAGAVLRSPEGHALGTLCVVDRKPRHLTDLQFDALRTMAGQVMTQLELRRAVAEADAEIAKRRRIEADLHGSEERLRLEHRFLDALIQQAPIGISIAEAPSGRAIVLNDKALALLGHGQTGSDFRRYEKYGALHADGRSYAVEDYPTMRALWHGEVVEREEMIYRRGDGRMTLLGVSSAPVRDGQGNIVAAVTTLSDIEEQHRAEERLRQQLELTRTITDNAADALLLLDTSDRVTFANPAAERLFGFEQDELLGRVLHNAVHYQHPHGEPFAAADCALFQAVVSGTPLRNHEEVCLRKDGAPIHVICASAPLVADGRVTGAVIAIHDITERKRVEEALRRAKEEAERANRSKSNFLAAASHDLRQPLQSLLLFLDVLKPHVAPEGQEALKHLGRGLDALRDLLDSLLDVSRLDARVVQPSIEDFPVRDLLDQIGVAYRPVAAAKGIECRVESCMAVVRSDRTLLSRMVRNLVENALRYTEAGRIEVRCRETDGRLHIEIHDTGIGIPPEHLERIWDEFHQVGNPERDRNRGLGLGLAIVQRLSALLDHPIHVRSMPGRGSVFGIEVPLGAAAPAHVLEDRTEAAGTGRLAVLVDDDAMVLLGLKATFEAWGYEVLVAGSADQAVEGLLALGRPPDILVADYRLRGGRVGTEAVLKIRQACGADVPGILLTGETGAEIRSAAAEFDLAIIHKPVTPRQLGEVLAKLSGAQ